MSSVGSSLTSTHTINNRPDETCGLIIQQGRKIIGCRNGQGSNSIVYALRRQSSAELNSRHGGINKGRHASFEAHSRNACRSGLQPDDSLRSKVIVGLKPDLQDDRKSEITPSPKTPHTPSPSPPSAQWAGENGVTAKTGSDTLSNPTSNHPPYANALLTRLYCKIFRPSEYAYSALGMKRTCKEPSD